MSKIHEGSDLEEYLPPRNLEEAAEQLKSRKVHISELFTTSGRGHDQRVSFTAAGRLMFLAKALERGLTPVDASRQAHQEWINK